MSENSESGFDSVALSAVSKEQLEKILDASPLGVAICKYYDGSVVYVNSTLADWAKLSVEEMVGTSAVIYYRDLEALGLALEELKQERPVTNYEMKMGLPGEKEHFWRQVNMVAIWVAGERMILSWYNDITELREARENLIHLAKHDPLTGLANIGHFNEHLNALVDKTTAASQAFSLLYLDLDGFKRVNDTHGHQFGNLLLQAVVERIKQVLDVSDFAARIGGDEFAVVIEADNGDLASAVEKAEKILEAVRQPYEIGDKTASLSISIGIAHLADHGKTADYIITQADNAMYEAKRGGKNRACLANSYH
jgi:diguanylate cyclase (GGDEF)-like protein